jgi:hypothetical protein
MWLMSNIGYLFYAAACEGGSLSLQDLNRLRDLIEKDWKTVTNGDPVLNMHLVDCIHAGVRYAIENGMSADEALTSFVNYYTIHPLPFSKTLREKILASAVQIGKDFSSNPDGSHAKREVEKLFRVEFSPV